MVLTDRKQINGKLIYKKYVALIFQIAVLPLLLILYVNNIISYYRILYFGINYFLSDIPGIIYQKDYKYLFHHFLAFFFYYIAIYYVSKNLYTYILKNVVLMELGSSMLSIDLIFNYKVIIKNKHNIFLLSRVLTMINTYLLCLKINSFFINISIIFFFGLLMIHNFGIYQYLKYKSRK